MGELSIRVIFNIRFQTDPVTRYGLDLAAALGTDGQQTLEGFNLP